MAVLAAALRVWGLDHQLPYLPLPGEDKSLRVTLTMLYGGTADPGFFHYPSLPFYVYAVALETWATLAGWATGTEVTPGVVERVALGVARVSQPAVVLVLRGLVAGAGVLTALLCAGAAWRLTADRRAAALAGGLVAVSPLLVEFGHVARHDGWVPLFVAAALFTSARLLKDPGWGPVLAAGAWVGLAVSSKYNAAVLLAVPAVAVVLGRGLAWRPLVGLTAAAAAAFALTSPYVVLDPATAWADIAYELAHYGSDHLGRDSGRAGHYPLTLLRLEGPTLLLAGLGLLRGGRTAWLAGAFLGVYAVAIQVLPVKVDRMLLPLLPALGLLAALGWHRVRSRAVDAVAGVALAWGIVGAIGAVQELEAPDARHDARAWLAEALPTGSRVAMESFGPFVDPRRHDVEAIPAGRGFSALWVHDPAWYRDEGFDVLVRASGTSGRYRQDRGRHAEALAGYRALEQAFPLWRTFEGGGRTVWVYRVRGDSGYSGDWGRGGAPADAR